MIRRPEVLPDSEWEEEYTIVDVRDAYKHHKRGRILEFFTESHQLRNVAILDIELKPSIVHRLLDMNLGYR